MHLNTTFGFSANSGNNHHFYYYYSTTAAAAAATTIARLLLRLLLLLLPLQLLLLLLLPQTLQRQIYDKDNKSIHRRNNSNNIRKEKINKTTTYSIEERLAGTKSYRKIGQRYNYKQQQ